MPKPTPEQLRAREEFLIGRRQIDKEACERLGLTFDAAFFDKLDAQTRKSLAENDAKMDDENDDN
jgi:hypothetical protein